MNYEEILVRTNAIRTMDQGDEGLAGAMERIRGYFDAFSDRSIRERTRQVYAPEAYLNDNITTVVGAESIERYFLSLLRLSKHVTFEMKDQVSHGREHYLRWAMAFALPLRPGHLIRSHGMSHLRLDEQGRILVQQDFWDSMGGLFEHVPLMGLLFKLTKRTAAWGVRAA